MKEERDYHLANKSANIKTKETMKKDYEGVDKSHTYDITEKSGEHHDKVENLGKILNN